MNFLLTLRFFTRKIKQIPLKTPVKELEIDPLSQKFQDFIKSQKNKDTDQKVPESNLLNSISKSLLSGDIIDIASLNEDLSKEVEEFEQNFQGEEDKNFSKVLGEMLKEAELKCSDDEKEKEKEK